MRLGEAFRTSVEGLQAHKLRALLTALGIVFGVAAVIAMLAIGEGARREALEQIQLMGIRNVLVYDRPLDDVSEGEGRGNLSQGLVLADADAIRRALPAVENVVPERRVERNVRRGRESVEATVVGSTPDRLEVFELGLERGRFPDALDEAQAARVCVLGPRLRRELFHFEDPLGQELKVGKQWFTVVGVLDARAGTGSGPEEKGAAYELLVPLRTAMLRFHRDPFESELSRLSVRVREAGQVREAASILDRLLTRRHGEIDDYRIVVPEALLRQRQATQRIFNIVMGAIAGISLLVGGIGIMNIMLASVLERTREIGIRRAVGATRHDVMAQFLLEAVVVSFLGGILGIVLGFVLSRIIATAAGWTTVILPLSVALAFGVSAAVGIVFGFYPARRAARMSPIECLRYE